VVPEKQGLKPSLIFCQARKPDSLSSGSRKTRIETKAIFIIGGLTDGLSSGSRKTRIETHLRHAERK